MDWVRALAALREQRRAGVLVTVAASRGHAPRQAGAKMVVAAQGSWGTVGGGNLEATATARARELLAALGEGPGDVPGARAAAAPELMTVALSEHAPARYAAQCCGGEVTLLLEPLPVAAAVAVFGLGHVGTELALVLARHDLDLHLVDSRAAQTRPECWTMIDGARARVRVHRVGVAPDPPLPEMVLADLPAGTHVLVMTHDHGEDAALCDAALRRDDLGSIGLIGSSAKAARFRARLAEVGHGPAALDRITTPIGLPGLTGEPAAIAVGVAAALLTRLGRERPGPASSPGRRQVEPSG